VSSGVFPISLPSAITIAPLGSDLMLTGTAFRLRAYPKTVRNVMIAQARWSIPR